MTRQTDAMRDLVRDAIAVELARQESQRPDELYIGLVDDTPEIDGTVDLYELADAVIAALKPPGASS